MGMKTQNIWFNTPKINPQSNPNKFGGGKRLRNLLGGGQNGDRRRGMSAEAMAARGNNVGFLRFA